MTAYKLIGLAGTFASGKDTLAQYLVEKHGFYHVSTGDIFREEAMKRYGSIERPVLYKTANEIRSSEGHGAVSQRALDRYRKVQNHYKGLVVSGFRALAEAEVVKNQGGTIIFVDAPVDLRYKRLKDRARVEEGTLSYEEFKKREDAENGGVDPAFNIRAIKNIADYTIINDSDYDTFIKQIDEIMNG